MLSYERFGTGTPVVLVHGITESRHSWDPLIEGLSAHYDVVALDLRGHGNSTHEAPYDLTTMAGDVGELVAHLGLESPLMVGHSLGGLVVSAYATQGACRGVVNVDQVLEIAAFKELLTPFEVALKASTEEFNETFTLMMSFMRGRLDDASWQRLNELRRLDQGVVLGVWEIVFDLPAEVLNEIVDAMAGALQVPYLALHGMDPGPLYAPWLSQRVASARLEVWDGDGHYPHLVQPERFIARVRAFDESIST